MGVAIPRPCSAVNDSASGAQVIDGSLKFDGGYLTRTPGSAGNRKTWTYSCWVKFDNNVTQSEPLLCAGDSSSDFTTVYTYKTAVADIALAAKTSSSDKVEISSDNLLRDTGWYHIVAAFDSEHSSYQTDTTIYVNGVEITRNTNTYAGGENYEGWVNSTSEPHYIGLLWNGNTFKGEMSQAYLIDGQALGPSYFGYTDPLTNTWRPKKCLDGDQAAPNSELLYNVNTSDNGFDSSSTSRSYDAASRTFTTYSTPQSANPGGYGANSAHVYKSPTGGAITWLVSTDTTDRYIWTSSDGENWSSIGSTYDTDGSTQSVYAVYIALAAGSNASNVTVTSPIVDFGTNGFDLPMDGNSPIERTNQVKEMIGHQ